MAQTEILFQYMNYNYVFLFKSIIKLSENINITEHLIKLENGKQLFYKLIYSLKLIKLVTLKIYIKTYLKTRFISLIKFFINTVTIFDEKPNSSFWLCINYQSLNNLAIKN